MSENQDEESGSGSSQPLLDHGAVNKSKHAKTYEQIYAECEKAPWYFFHKQLQYYFRAIVSQNRRRTSQLDLSLITPRVIAMGFPAKEGGFDGQIRNPIPAVTQFLDRYTNQCRVYNLKGGKPYNSEDFKEGVVFYEMADHEPPRFEYMFHFVEDVKEFLKKTAGGAVVVHCKAGKGRTGVMICAYLYDIGFYRNPRQVLDFYGIARTVNNQGLTIPSQRRYVYYYSHLKKHGMKYKKHVVQLVGIYFEHVPPLSNLLPMGTADLKIEVAAEGVLLFKDSTKFSYSAIRQDKQSWIDTADDPAVDYNMYEAKRSVENEFSNRVVSNRCYGWTLPKTKPVFIEGDVCISLKNKNVLGSINRLGEVFFNTQFCCEKSSGGHYCHGDMENKYPEGTTSLSTAAAQSTTRSDIIMPNSEAWNAHVKDWFESKELERVNEHYMDLIVGAHRSGYVNDKYNEERAKNSEVPLKRESRVADPKTYARPTKATEQFVLQLGLNENAQAYETCEIDYAAKHHSLPPCFKLIVVTKCVVNGDETQHYLATEYITAVRELQRTKREAKYTVVKNANEKLGREGDSRAQILASNDVDSDIKRLSRQPSDIEQSCYNVVDDEKLVLTTEERNEFAAHVAMLE